MIITILIFFFQAEDGIRDLIVTGVQTCALPISRPGRRARQVGGFQVADSEIRDKALQFVEALGGAENISEMEGCITRLRGTLVDASKVDVEIGRASCRERV